jgi:hypothetical protein
MMRTVLWFVLAAGLALGTDAWVRVRVRDGDTGRWLAGVSVRAGKFDLFTNEDGECVVLVGVGERLVLQATMEYYYEDTETLDVTSADMRIVLRLYEGKPRTVIGFVKDGSSGRRLPGALVSVVAGKASARTDSVGVYSIPFPPGDRELVASLPGFRGFPRRLSVKAGDTLSVDLPLYDTSLAVGEVAGRIEVQGFGAAIGANVTVEGTRLGTASDRNGDYVITGVPAGQHRLIFTYVGCRKTMRVVNVAAWKSLTQNVQLERRPPPSQR